MGRASQRRQAFFAKHPLCCFCGGEAEAVEIDHTPSRSLFTNRRWPEGFEFPACRACNRASKLDEEIVAFLSRAYPDPTTPDEIREYRALCRSFSERRPEILKIMQPSRRQVRTELRRRGFELPPGQTTRDVPFLSVSNPLIDSAVRNFARKLNLALFYHHVGRIVPSNGGVAIRWYTNTQIHHGELPGELANVIPGMPTLKRTGDDLSGQFFYRYGIIDTRDAAIFVSVFRGSFAIVAGVHVDASRLPEIAAKDILAPYDHTERNSEQAGATMGRSNGVA